MNMALWINCNTTLLDTPIVRFNDQTIFPVFFSPSLKSMRYGQYNIDKWLMDIKEKGFKGIVLDDFNCTGFRTKTNNFHYWNLPSIIELFKASQVMDIIFCPVVYELNFSFHRNYEAFKQYCRKSKVNFPIMIVPWMNMVSEIGMAKSLVHVKSDFPKSTILSLIYGCATSWFPFKPSVRTFSKMRDIGLKYADGVVLYNPHSCFVNSSITEDTAC